MKLYQFKKLEKRRVETLKNKSLWLARPDKFNDPDDCSIAGLTAINKPQLKVLKEMVEAYYHEEFDFTESVLSDTVVSAIKTYIDNELKGNNEQLTGYIANKANVKPVLKKIWPVAAIKAAIQKSVGICCFFSGGIENVFMWKNYADQHTGFCIEYEYTPCSKSAIRPVSYVSRENWDSPSKGLVVTARELALCPEETFTRVITTKDISFVEEQEFRFVKPRAFLHDSNDDGREVAIPSYLKPIRAYTGSNFSVNSKDLQDQFKEAIRALGIEALPFSEIS